MQAGQRTRSILADGRMNPESSQKLPHRTGRNRIGQRTGRGVQTAAFPLAVYATGFAGRLFSFIDKSHPIHKAVISSMDLSVIFLLFFQFI